MTMFGVEPYIGLQPQLVTILSDIQKHAQDYNYYMTPCPWLQVKILQILQMLPPPVSDAELLSAING